MVRIPVIHCRSGCTDNKMREVSSVDVMCTQEQLQRALSQTARAVATKTALPSLSNVLIRPEDGRLRIAATNLELGITTWIDADVRDYGDVGNDQLPVGLSVDARLLGEFVATLPAGNVRLKRAQNRYNLDVSCGEGKHAIKAVINGGDPEDFPAMHADDEGFAATVDAQALREMVSQVEFAAATDESRPVLAGVLARFDGGQLTLAAADGFRLAVRSGELEQPAADKVDVIVPARAIRELARIVGDAEGAVRLIVSPNRNLLRVRVKDTEFVSRLIDGNFPDYRAIVPKDFQTMVTVGREALLSAVRRAGYFARDNNDVVRISVAEGEREDTMGSLEVSANAAERGSNQSLIDAVVQGPETQIAFNARYLTDVLGVLRSPSVVLGLNGGNQAGVLRSSDALPYDHVIMPMVIGAG